MPSGLVVCNGSNICASCSAGIPLPVSHTCQLHVRRGAGAAQGEGAPLGHGIDSVLHQIQQGTAEGARVHGDRPQVRDPFDPQHEPVGRGQPQPLLGPPLHQGPQVLRGPLARGHPRER